MRRRAAYSPRMDDLTHAFYARYAAAGAAAESPRSAMLPYLLRWLPAGSTVLDVGAGAGRDVAALLAAGLPAWGLEPHDGMRLQAESLFPATRGRLRPASLPELGRPWADACPLGFDAVVCSAVLMHVAPADLPRALASMVEQLGPAHAGRPARLLLAVPEMDAVRLTGGRDADARCFHNHAPATLQALLAAHGLALLEAAVNDAVLASAGTRWHMLVFGGG